MQEKFSAHIAENNLCLEKDRILIAVSGGVDSVVLLDLFIRAGYFCGIVHCNFKLRAEESDEDEVFVKELANRYEVPIFLKSFETEEYAEMNRLSIQMAARDLRYEWFEDIRRQQGFDLIATAHNKNDIVETFMVNLARGTGIQGLTGIRYKTNNLIRPLLFATRQEILDYAKRISLNWREDSSNSTLKYSRNKIRNQLLPLFEQINPKFTQTMIENIHRLNDTEKIYSRYVGSIRDELLIKEQGFITVSIEKVKSLSPLQTWLFELFRDFNFTAPVISHIIESLDGPPGRFFFSRTHRIAKDRQKLIIQPLKDSSSKKYYIEDPYREINQPLQIEMDVLLKNDHFKLSEDPLMAFLDLDMLEFPLIIRKWEKGDYFRPLGMKELKKLSDFFIDRKLSLPEKENTWLLTSGPEIIWVIGMRIDDRFKIRSDTKRILKIRIKD